MIPLSNLVEIHERWRIVMRDGEKEESPIGETLYRYIRVHGDEIERGEIPDFTTELISNLRALCWEVITRVAVKWGFLFRRSSEKQSSDEVRDIVVDTVKSAAYDLKEHMKVEPTRVTVLEYINEIYARWEKERRYPEHASAVVQLINERSDLVDEVIESEK